MSSTPTATPVRTIRKLCGFGHPLLDIISHVDREYLSKYNIDLGSVNLAAPDQLPVFESLSQQRNVEFVPGGASMNAVRVARWMVSKHEAAAKSCTYVGSLGDDEFGCILERALNNGGVHSIFQIQDEKQTGTCACCIVDKERSLLANLGAALDLSMSHMESEDVQQAIHDADIFYCEGFFLNTVSSPNNSLHIGKHCLENNKVFSYNLSAPYLCHIFKDRWVKILPFVDIIFGSRVDALALGEALEWEEKELSQVMMRILSMLKGNNPNQPPMVVVTGGSESTFVATFATGVIEFAVPPVPIESIVDTNGAGDAFVGGFLSQLMLSKPIDTCVACGHLAAAAIIQQNGCQFIGEPPELATTPKPSK